MMKVQQLQTTVDDVSVLGSGLLQSPFYTAGTSANGTLIQISDCQQMSGGRLPK